MPNPQEFRSTLWGYNSTPYIIKLSPYACLYTAITPETEFSGIPLKLIEQRHPRRLIST
jgi:hypothetical protein